MILIPQPKKAERRDGEFTIGYGSYLVLEESCGPLLTKQAMLFLDALEEETGYRPALTRGKGRDGDIILRREDALGPEDVLGPEDILGPEDVLGQGYTLEIRPEGIILTGGEKGLWHGMQTILQMAGQQGAVLPAMSIHDRPDIRNRGFYHDVTRGRVPKLSWLKKLANRMVRYKLNQMQLYIEHTFLFRDFSEIWRDDTPLTAEDILELDRYCLDRGIELVPSLSTFGHLYKILGSKHYSHLCELEGSESMPFSLRGRMHHHTINVSSPESLEFIKGKIREFAALFTSGQFNICADETFDLGKGRSSSMKESLGIHRLYINYVKDLCECVISCGKRPMFWGDVIAGEPELLKELPAETICLNWGYAKNQREDETRALDAAGAVQYLCPGVCGWNHLIPLYENAYCNIKIMCDYARKYEAVGVLNTDWGDFLHINHPEFSIPGMIYGAACSWNAQPPAWEEMNRQISVLEYDDSTGQLVGMLAKTQELHGFTWEMAVRFKELKTGAAPEYDTDHRQYLQEHMESMEGVNKKNRHLEEITRELYGLLPHMDRRSRKMVKKYVIAVEGIGLFNELGKVITKWDYGAEYGVMPDTWALSERLEVWLYHYKELYRSVSRESELGRIQEIIVWYGDYLRERR